MRTLILTAAVSVVLTSLSPAALGQSASAALYPATDATRAKEMRERKSGDVVWHNKGGSRSRPDESRDATLSNIGY